MTYSAQTFEVLKSLHRAKRPVIICGAGVRLAGAGVDARMLSQKLGIPVAPTWGALDMFPTDDPLTIGSFGTHGNRHGNFAVQNADWILAVGTRLDTKATGTPVESFAPHAKIFMVDIDRAEIAKFGNRVTGYVSHAAIFLQAMLERVQAVQWHEGTFPDFSPWLETIEEWKDSYPVSSHGPYRIISDLSDAAKPGDIICCDTGCTVAWIAQAWRFKEGQRLLHAWNQTPMGCGLPMAIGAHYATVQPVLLITGDGSLMMSIGELATIKGLPIRIALLNNEGHAMCRQTQREWMGGTYPATSLEGGLKFPDFTAVAKAFGVNLTEYFIDPDADVVPKVKYGDPNHDGHPLLPRAELDAQMFNVTEKTSCQA